jgi:hypothetical protein
MRFFVEQIQVGAKKPQSQFQSIFGLCDLDNLNEFGEVILR